jgi:hypothetical protein
MNKIFSTNDPEIIEHFRGKNRTDIKKTASENISSTAKQGHASHTRDADATEQFLSAQNRLALRNESVLQGLLAVKDLFSQPGAPDHREAELNTLITQTRFHDEQVLADYAKTLRTAVRDNDKAAVDYLVIEYQNKLSHAAKDKIIRENLSAAASLMPGDLLKDVVRTIKAEGLPEILITRQRAIDLLQNPS